MATITIKKLLESGAHFGHFAKKRHPEMQRSNYIFTKRNGIDIIDLQKTFNAAKQAYELVRDRVQQGKRILFVGTKKQAQSTVAEQAERSGAFYVNRRWCGGLFTNFSVVKHSIQELQRIMRMEEEGEMDQLSKKEQSVLRKKKERLLKLWAGVKDMRVLPDMLFVIDAKQEQPAILEAKKMGIFVIALVDTNSDPSLVDHVIPANDDAVRSIALFSGIIADAVLDGIQGENYQFFGEEGSENESLIGYERESHEARERVESNDEWAAESARYRKNEE